MSLSMESGEPRRSSIPCTVFAAGSATDTAWLRCGVIALVGLCFGLGGCGSESPQTGWAGSVDTLPNGTIMVHNPAAGLWHPDSGWHLVEDLRIGSIDVEGPALFGSVAGYAVDGMGRIYVLDRHARELRVFDREGTHVRTVGRDGAGPGEFGDPIAVAVEPASQWLVVVDVGNGRYTRFDTAGIYLGTTPRRIGGYSVPAQVGFDPEGRFYEGASARFGDDSGPALFRFDATLARSDTFRIPTHDTEEFELVLGEAQMTVPVPFAARLLWALDERGRYWTGITDRMRFVEHKLNGEILRVVDRDFEPLRVTAEEKERAIENLSWFTKQGGRVDASRIHDVKPAFRRIGTSPDGHLWVLVTSPAREAAYRFDVYDPEGRYLGEVKTDVAWYPRPLFRGDRVYGTTTDSLGVTYLVRARIERAARVDPMMSLRRD